ncbi:hypothetical protein QAD02_013717 [Eretmocerus hayati]|uniref:Uncharacterized protein n=1 Tax=Eretmocerus hayati TaxID=131215 RepID=A0ACC2P3F8_9HYME|nr:hypothetical protein QAD02_013717 [Eretmocerus hayati]
MWDICEFENQTVSLVPQGWRNKNGCFWPPYKTDARINNAIATSAPPNASWRVVGIKRKLGGAATKKHSRNSNSHLRNLMLIKSIFKGKRTRYERHKKNHESDDSSDDLGEIRKTEFPKPPTRRVAPSLPGNSACTKEVPRSTNLSNTRIKESSTVKQGNLLSQELVKSNHVGRQPEYVQSSTPPIQSIQGKDMFESENSMSNVRGAGTSQQSGRPRVKNIQNVNMKLTVVRDRRDQVSNSETRQQTPPADDLSIPEDYDAERSNDTGKCDEIIQSQAELSVSINNSAQQSHDDFEGFDEYFEIKTPKEFDTFNVNLKNKMYAQRVKRYFDGFTVKDARKSTSAVLRGLIHNEVAQLYNFPGQNKKKEFQNLRSWVILRGMLTSKGFKRNEVEDAAKDFFRYAKKRVERAKNRRRERGNIRVIRFSKRFHLQCQHNRAKNIH